MYSAGVECSLTHEDSFPPNSNHLAVNSTPKHSVLFSNFPTPMMLWTLENPGCCRGRLNLPPRIITDSHYCKQCLCVSVCVNGGFMIIVHFPWVFSFVSLWNVISHPLLFFVFPHNFSVLFEFFDEPLLRVTLVLCNTVFVWITALIICPGRCLCHTITVGKGLNQRKKDASAGTPHIIVWARQFTSKAVKNKDEKIKKTFPKATTQTRQLLACPTCQHGSN